MYRFAVILYAGISTLLCGLAIYFQIEALTKWRREDLHEATRVEDWEREGTCVGVIMADHYNSGELHQNCAGKGTDDNPSDSLKKLRNALAVSVHGLYFAYANGVNDPLMREVVVSVLSSTINPDMDSVGSSINHSAASTAITSISDVDVPSTNGCDAIYAQTKTSLEADAAAYAFYRRLMEGYKEDDAHSEWPLADIAVACDGSPSDDPAGTQIDPDALSDASTMRLYAHCKAQFQFASSGIDPWMGTFGIPLVGWKPGPSAGWYPSPEHFNSSRWVDYNTKTRMYLGMRFGYSVWAYIPMLIASCYLGADALMFFLAEATLPDALDEMHVHVTDRLSMTRNSLVMAATSKSSRRFRFGFAVAALFVSGISWLVFSAIPFGFVYRTMPRPVCEVGDPNHLTNNVNNFGFQGSKGGWKADWDATWYELAILAIQVFVVLLEGLVTNPLCSTCNNLGLSGENSGEGQRLDQGVVDAFKLVTNTSKIRRFARTFLGLLVLGAVIMIAGQAVSGASFGMKWAEGIMGTRMKTDDAGVQTPLFNPVTLSEQVYDQTVATISVTLVAGLVIGVATQRHLINGIGCFSATLFFAWVGLVIFPFFALLIYASVRPITNQDDANKDCEVLANANEAIAQTACEARWWSLLAGGGLLLIVLLIMTVIGLFEALPNILRMPNKAAVRLRKFRGWHQSFREGGEMNSRSSIADSESLLNHRAGSDHFFKFQTNLSSSDTLLYPTRVSFRK